MRPTPDGDAAPTLLPAVYFAPPPLCRRPRSAPRPPQLLNGTHAVVDYAKGGDDACAATIWDPAWQDERTFSSVDLDAWGRTFLAAVDDLLAPDMASALRLNSDGRARYLEPSAGVDPDLHAALLAAREDLAEAISGSIQPILLPTSGSGSGDIDQARQLFKHRLVAELSAAYRISTIVQVPMTVSATGAHQGGIGSSGVTLWTEAADGALAAPGLAASTAPAPQTSRTAPPLFTFLVTVADPRAQSVVVADLGFDVGDTGTDAGVAARTSIGRLVIPIALRAYPETPRLLAHRALATERECPPPDLRALREWTYELAFEQAAAAQDRIELHVAFNRNQADLQALRLEGAAEDGAVDAALRPDATRPPPQDLFEALARFSVEHPQLQPVLQQLANPDADPDVRERACLAAVRIHALIRDAATAWLDRAPVRETAPDANEPVSTGSDAFLIASNPEDVDRDITIAATPADADLPLVSWPGMPADAGEPHGRSRTYLLPATLRGSPSRVLTLSWPARDLMARQNATANAWLTRNAALADPIGDGWRTNDLFVYRTPATRFADAVVPLLQYDGDMTLPDGSVGFRTALGAVLTSLFGVEPVDRQAAGAGRWAIQMGVSYRFEPGNLQQGFEDETLPAEVAVLISPFSSFAFPDDCDAGRADSYVSRLADAVADWHSRNRPPGGGLLRFDLTIFVDLDDGPRPILQLSRLLLPVGSDDVGWWGR